MNLKCQIKTVNHFFKLFLNIFRSSSSGPSYGDIVVCSKFHGDYIFRELVLYNILSRSIVMLKLIYSISKLNV